MEQFEGSWVLESSENFEGYMDAIGVNYFMKKLANLATPSQEIKVDGDEVTIKTSTGKIGRTSEIKFRPEEEFEEKTIDGRLVKSKVTWKDDMMIHKQSGEPVTLITRTIKDGKYIMTLEANKKKCTRTYKRTK